MKTFLIYSATYALGAILGTATGFLIVGEPIRLGFALVVGLVSGLLMGALRTFQYRARIRADSKTLAEIKAEQASTSAKLTTVSEGVTVTQTWGK